MSDEIWLKLDEKTLDWVERGAAKYGVTPTAYIRGWLWHCRRLGLPDPPEAKMTGREQTKLLKHGPLLGGG